MTIEQEETSNTEELPHNIFLFHSNTTLRLDHQINESKQLSVSRDSVLIYNNRQKMLDWFKTLIRNYEVILSSIINHLH